MHRPHTLRRLVLTCTRRSKSAVALETETKYALRVAMQAVPAEYRGGLAVVTAASAVLNLGAGCIVPVLPSYIGGTLGLSAAGVGAVLAAPSMTKLVLNQWAGRWADSSGRVPLMAGGEIVAAAGVAATGLATSLPAMLAARGAMGAGAAAATAGTAAWTADLTSLESVRPHRGVVLGSQSAAVSAAWVLGPAAGGILSASLGGAQPMFLGVAAVTAACAVAYAKCVPEIQERASPQQVATTSTLELLADPAQRGAVIANAALASNYALALAILPIQYAHVAGAGPLEIGYLFSAVSALGIVGGPLSGFISDRCGRVAVLAPGLGLVALGNALLAAATDANTLILAAFVWGAGEAVAAPAVAALTADVAPANSRGQSLALSRTSADLSFLIVPPALGLVADLAGDASTPFYLASGLTALAAIRFVLPGRPVSTTS